ncbi:PTS sugar transporter subunit IIC [Olsenella sp. An293]|uniref:PTS mannose/fructose/sorbose/N-acetylgalactosamine transporter subunit IIC n=1 Tax=Olsenella sp. An293 TaxID=1965626 RepID=UPI000B391F82|nr:PTS sugar transporter subunit IIC [Olsenella sp. An293]OUO33881.1 PTS sugar transporter [Olsenella sp. An293]
MQALLVGIVAFIGFLECGIGNSMIQRPIVMGPLIGLVLGDLTMGLQVGATLELAFMGTQAIGSALPPEITAGGVLGAAFAITSGSGVEAAIALCLPIASLALIVKNLYYVVVRGWMLHMSDKCAAAGDDKGVATWHWVSFLSYALVMAVLCGGAFYVGGPAVEAFLAIIPQFVQDGLTVASGILPALGFALLASMLVNKDVAPYFLIGFLLVAYLGVPVLGIALLGVLLVILMLGGNKLAPATATSEEMEDEDF